jgi:Tfp pilus assembly protein PilF
MTPGEIILNALGTVIGRFPGSAGMHFERARIFDGLGDAAAAEADYRRAIERDRRHFRAHNDLGLLYYRSGRLVDALHCFVAAVEADESAPAGHANLGVVLLAADDIAGAKEEFQRALVLEPSQPTALQGVTALCERLGLTPPAPVEPARRSGPASAPGMPAVEPDPFVDYVFEIAANGIIAHDGAASLAFLDIITGDDARYAGLWWRVADCASSLRSFAVARTAFDRAIAHDPANADLHRGRAIVLEESGDLAAAAAAWSAPPLRGAYRVVPYAGAGEPVRLLTIASALHAIRYELFTDPAAVRNTVLYTQGYAPEQPLPEHDVVLVAVADVESDGPALGVAAEITARTHAPVINRPERVWETSRTAQAVRLAAIPDVVTARIERASRAEMLRAGAGAYVRGRGYAYPVLLRSPGFHNGRFFELVENDADAARVAAEMPTDEVLVLSYEDTRASDGLVRKYRAMSIDGELYPVHLAISAHWKVHYVSSAMADRADLRLEEAAYLDDMEAAIGTRAVLALQAIAAAMRLDYAGIDFGLAPDGRVVVYEANGAMAIFLPDDDPRWDYRRAAMTRALHAATRMIVERGVAARSQVRNGSGANA